MKTMTCKQLAGACDKEFHAETFDEMVEMSKKHGMEMVGKGDVEHIKVMEKVKGMKPEAMKEMVEKIQKEFDAIPEDK
jgi:PHP family Zn ribbon phosphoesterase